MSSLINKIKNKIIRSQSKNNHSNKGFLSQAIFNWGSQTKRDTKATGTKSKRAAKVKREAKTKNVNKSNFKAKVKKIVKSTRKIKAKSKSKTKVKTKVATRSKATQKSKQSKSSQSKKRRRKRKRKLKKIKQIIARLFSPFAKANSKVFKRKRQKFVKKAQKFLIILFLIVAFGIGVYSIGKSVINIKLGNSTTGDQAYTLEGAGEDVLGIEGVPQYPNSEFLFADHIEDEEVQDFLDKNKSAYSIPLEKSWVDVVEFYKRELKKRGWQHVNSIDRSDEFRMYGEYWIKVSDEEENDEIEGDENIRDGSSSAMESANEMSKKKQSGGSGEMDSIADSQLDTETDADTGVDANADTNTDTNATSATDTDVVSDTPSKNLDNSTDSPKGRGLRVYTQLNDIWYEEITVSQAETALANVVAKRRELNFLISMSSGEKLPKSSNWDLQFAPVWDYEFEDSEFSGIKTVKFINPETQSKLLLKPIGVYSKDKEDFSEQEFTDLAEQFIDEINEFRDSEDEFKLGASQKIKVAGEDAMRYNIQSDSSLGSLAIIVNEDNQMFYVVATYKGDTGFFEYVIENIKIPQEEEEKR